MELHCRGPSGEIYDWCERVGIKRSVQKRLVGFALLLQVSVVAGGRPLPNRRAS